MKLINDIINHRKKLKLSLNDISKEIYIKEWVLKNIEEKKFSEFKNKVYLNGYIIKILKYFEFDITLYNDDLKTILNYDKKETQNVELLAKSKDNYSAKSSDNSSTKTKNDSSAKAKVNSLTKSKDELLAESNANFSKEENKTKEVKSRKVKYSNKKIDNDIIKIKYSYIYAFILIILLLAGILSFVYFFNDYFFNEISSEEIFKIDNSEVEIIKNTIFIRALEEIEIKYNKELKNINNNIDEFLIIDKNDTYSIDFKDEIILSVKNYTACYIKINDDDIDFLDLPEKESVIIHFFRHENGKIKWRLKE